MPVKDNRQVSDSLAKTPPFQARLDHEVTRLQPSFQKVAVPRSYGGCLAGMHVLVVDDLSDNRLLMQEILTRHGAFVDTAQDGEEAVRRACETACDVVLMDIQMPILNGLAATTRLRKLGFRKPIFALSARAMRPDRAKSLDAGCTEHLTRPLNMATLLRVLQTVASDGFGRH